MVTFGSNVGNHQFQPFLSGVYASVIIELNQLYAIRWPCFSANFHGFQGIVVQVHQLYAPRCGKTHILAWRRCLPHVDVLKGGFFHSSSCHACLGQASVSLGAPRMPTNLLHHGSQNRIQKTSRNMAARKGPRLYTVVGAIPSRCCTYGTVSGRTEWTSGWDTCSDTRFCFFTCKDRASERDRPYQRKKKLSWTVQWNLHVCMVHSGFRDIGLSGAVCIEVFTKWILRFFLSPLARSGTAPKASCSGAYQLLWESARIRTLTLQLFCSVVCVCVFFFV